MRPCSKPAESAGLSALRILPGVRRRARRPGTPQKRSLVREAIQARCFATRQRAQSRLQLRSRKAAFPKRPFSAATRGPG